jgi:hypothetical protein
MEDGADDTLFYVIIILLNSAIYIDIIFRTINIRIHIPPQREQARDE